MRVSDWGLSEGPGPKAPYVMVVCAAALAVLFPGVHRCRLCSEKPVWVYRSGSTLLLAQRDVLEGAFVEWAAGSFPRDIVGSP